MESVLFGLAFVSALGCGLVAGVFFAFSTFVMKALARLPAAQGIAAMQSINVAAITPLFMIALFGTAAACVVLAAFAVADWGRAGTVWLLGGGLVYAAGTALVTMVCNVPRNNALAAVDAAGSGSAAEWTRYVHSWTAWNHVRTIAAAAGAAALIIGLLRIPR